MYVTCGGEWFGFQTPGTTQMQHDVYKLSEQLQDCDKVWP